MHPQPLEFISRVRAFRPRAAFTGSVVEAGSLNMNGSTRDTVLVDHESWVGVDWRAGNGVDVVSVFHEWDPGEDVLFDTAVQTEMAEHDQDWKPTLAKMVGFLKPGGNLWFTCAARARPVHEKHVGRDAWYQGLDLVEVLAELRKLADFDEIVCEQNYAPAADTYIAALGKRPQSGGYIGHPTLLSVVIPTCQDRWVPRCLKTHTELSSGVSEFIVVANGVEADAKERLLTLPRFSILAFYDVNLGYPAACNVGIQARHPQARAVVLANDDTEAVLYQWDERVLDILAGEPEIGALSPVTNFVANPFQRHGIVPTPELYGAPVLFFVWTAFPVSVFETVGLLDERFGLGNFEDFDYSIRLREAGLSLVVDPVHGVYHRGHGTFSLLPPGQFAAVLNAAETALRAKWGARLAEFVG